MRKISLFAFCFLALAAITFVSCKKQVATAVEGDWKKVVLDGGVDSDSAIWHFQGGTLTIQNLSDTTQSDEGNYVVVEKNLSNYVRISGLTNITGESRLNGDWRVIQYKHDLLTLAKSDESLTTGEDVGTILREFTRL